MCSVTQHQRRRRQMSGNILQIHPVVSLLSGTENDLSWLKNLFIVIFQLIWMSSYAKNKLLMCSVTQHQCRRRQMWGNISQIHPVHSLFICYKKWLFFLFMVRFQLISLSSYAKNKLQLCSVTQHQCRCCQMCWNFSQIHPVHSLFICYTEWLVLTEQFFPVRFQLISLSSYAKNKLQMFSVIQHQCRRRQMWKNF